MKSSMTSSKPFDEASIAAAIAAAPETARDPDYPYDPDDAACVEAFWNRPGVIVSHIHTKN